jgi:hypothetical protein
LPILLLPIWPSFSQLFLAFRFIVSLPYCYCNEDSDKVNKQ